jgi:hypothetical protein
MISLCYQMSSAGVGRGAIDPPWLIRVKRAAGRPKDLEVIAELEALDEEIRHANAAPSAARTVDSEN